MKRLPIILVDFDGVLHRYSTGWKGHDVVDDVPVKGAIEWLEGLVASGRFSVNIYSSRCRFEEGVDAMAAWLVAHGLSEEALQQIGFPHEKMAAFLTIDDRAWCFAGEFPTEQQILEFKPWYNQ